MTESLRLDGALQPPDIQLSMLSYLGTVSSTHLCFSRTSSVTELPIFLLHVLIPRRLSANGIKPLFCHWWVFGLTFQMELLLSELSVQRRKNNAMFSVKDSVTVCLQVNEGKVKPLKGIHPASNLFSTGKRPNCQPQVVPVILALFIENRNQRE